MAVHCLCVLCLADQVYGDQDWHSVVRNQCLDYMVSQLCPHVLHTTLFTCFVPGLMYRVCARVCVGCNVFHGLTN